MKSISSGLIRVEQIQRMGDHPLEDVIARIVIEAADEAGMPSYIEVEGPLGPELMHLLHALTIMCHDTESEWVIPTMQHPLQLIRHGTTIVLAIFPLEHSGAGWLVDERLHHVSFSALLFSLSTIVEELLGHMSPEFADDESVEVLVHQWERLWRWSSRLFTFGALRLGARI